MRIAERVLGLPASGSPEKSRLVLLALTAIVLLFVWLRVPHLSAFSFTIDEATMVACARGVLERGYPYVMVGTMEVPLATYELLPYPIALSMALFGGSEWAVRLPAFLFSLGSLLLLYRMASVWFDRRVALFTALLYALSPWAIYWGSNAFHPAQAQFFALLTLIQGQRILREQTPPTHCYGLAALYFSLAYLSWEGIGFLLPIVFIAGLVLNWGQWKWLQQRGLWLAITAVATVVILQGVRRVMLQVSYLMVGSGKSETSMPQLVFTQMDYNPWFYIRNLFALENHVVLTAVFLAGLLLLRRSWNLRFVYVLVLGAVFFLTNFLPFTSAHYIYWVLPFFFMACSAVTFMAADMLAPSRHSTLRMPQLGAAALLTVFLGLAVASVSPFGLQLYGISPWQDNSRPDLRVGLAEADYRTLARNLRAQLQPGDVVITLATLPTQIYGGTKGDYFLQSVTSQKVVYDPGAGLPRYVDKYAGVPVLRSQAELEDVLYRNHRVWLLVAPTTIFNQLQDRRLIEFINQRFRTVSETYDGALYLWER